MKALVDHIRWRLGMTEEARCLRVLRRIPLAAGDIVLDCGANVGIMTAALVRDGAVVHAFEPNPHAFAVLAKRFAGNEQVTCHPVAVGTAAGHLPLFLHEKSEADEVLWSNGSSLLAEKPNVSCKRFVEVEVIDLAAFVLGLGRRVRVAKMDIEGAEVAVLAHLEERGALAQIDELFVETHELKIPSLAGATQQLRERLRSGPSCRVHFDWV